MQAKVSGFDPVLLELRALQRIFPEAAKNALMAEGYGVFRDSQEIVPVRGKYGGTLMRSGRTAIYNDSRRGVAVYEIKYSADYAAAVHEMTSSPSGEPINWSRPGSGAKYLENPLKEHRAGMLERMAARIKSETGI